MHGDQHALVCTLEGAMGGVTRLNIRTRVSIERSIQLGFPIHAEAGR